jgi:hypothetical protein
LKTKRDLPLANVGYVGFFVRNLNTEPKPRRQVMKKFSMFVGLDIHKTSIEIAIAEAGRDGEVLSFGAIDGGRRYKQK